MTRAKAEGDLASAGLDESELDGLFGFHLRMANSVVTREFLRKMRVLGLTQKSFATLTLIRSNPGVSQGELARHLNVDKATMTAVVDRLRQEDLVELRESEGDKRRRDVFLTLDGEAVWSTAKQRAAEFERQYERLLTQEELRVTLSVLKRVSRL